MGVLKNLQSQQAGGVLSNLQEQQNTIKVGGVPLSLGDRQKEIASQLNPVQNVGVGLVKGALSTVKGMGTLGTKIAQAALPSSIEPKGADIYNPETEIGAEANKILAPAGIAQTGGYIGEKVGEMVIPGKGLSLVDNALGGIKNVAGRILAKTGTEAAAQGALGYVQSGGDIEAAKTQAILGGGLKAASTGVGELAKAANYPTRLYQAFLKDLGLAKEAKNRGLQGTLSGMSDDVSVKIPELENKVVTIAKESGVEVPVNKKLSDVFSAMADDLSKLADDELAQRARSLAEKAKGEKIDMETALEMRRFLDSEIAYTKSGLAPKGDRVLKSFADELRKNINESDLGAVMKDYQFYLKTAEALRKEAQRAGNREVIGLFDTILFGSGLSAGEPLTGLAVSGTQKALRSIKGRTALAQMLEKLPETTTKGSAIKSGLSQLFNLR